MKKRVLPIFLAVIMLIVIVPFGSIKAFAAEPACKIEETEVGYDTLQKAINEVEDDQTIKVNQDLTCGTPISINNGKTFTIDFNDGSTQHSFTWMGSSSMTSNQDIFTIEANSNVTVKNMNYLVGGNVSGNRIFKVNATGTLLLSNMYCVYAEDNKIQDTPVVNNGGTVVIDGGNIYINNAQSLSLLNPVVQNLGGTTTFKGNGIYTTQANTGAAWLGRVITMNNDSTDDDLDTDCGTVTIENGTFSGGHILDVNGSGIVVINDATYNSGTGPIIKTYHGGIKSNITVKNITTSSRAFSQVIEELQTKIDFQNGNVKYTPKMFCTNGKAMNSVSIKNGKFGPLSGETDIHDEINNLLASGSTLTALTDDSDGYTYKVETSTPPTHTHTFTYTANNNKLIATCTSGCDEGYDLNPLTLTLKVPSSLVYDGIAKAVTFADGEGDAWTAAGLEIPTISYFYKEGSDYCPLNETPKTVGNYKAKITWGGRDAQVEFAITKAGSPEPDPLPPDPEPEPEPEKYYIEDLENQLNTAIQYEAGPDTVILWTAGDSLPQSIIELIFNSNVTVEFKFTYEGVEYDLFLNKDNVKNLNIPWYGPYVLASFANGTYVGNGGNEYVVLTGDTMSIIAAKFGMTLEELAAMNPQITNINMIYEGQVIRVK